MSKNVELINNSNDWNEWIEDAISKKNIRYYEYKDFSNIQEIGSGGFAKVCRANWKNSHIRYALKSFIKIDNATIKAIVREIQLHRQVDYHDNVIRFYGVTSSIKENQRKEYSLVIEYADNVHAVSCLHEEGIIHRDLHSNNVLVHQHAVKLSDFGLSKSIEETSNSQSKAFGLIPYTDPKSFNRNITPLYLLNKKSDVYSIGVLLWEISSGQPPFHGTSYDVSLAISILQGLRETPIPETPKNYIKIYTDCWNIEPDNRPTINQVIDELKAIIIKENIIIKDFHLYNDNKEINQSSINHQPNSNTENLENSYSSFHENSQIIDFTDVKEIESSISSNNQTENENENDFNIIVNDITNFLKNNSNEIGKQEVLNYLKNQNITLQEINNLLLNDQNNSNYIFLLGNFNYLGIGTDSDKKKAFELYQKAANLGNVIGINNLGYYYQSGIGTDVDKKKAFELFQMAADLRYALGINNLGNCYYFGIGTDIDKKKASELYQKAADLGNNKVQHNLSFVFQAFSLSNRRYVCGTDSASVIAINTYLYKAF
ncbi:kinase-like domain-containing protein [Rhizophagus clarus]|uniref:Kinase-like domain-containing protein n=1 Tax=Rhizophagus clarus TaxID=94130 RepID=A0A8H3QXW4_9GLOM|nr:kinase-like domain-containing protein [Rhizophagus clarus]